MLTGPFSYDYDEATSTLSVHGEIDRLAVDALAAAIETYRHGPMLRVDLTMTTFLPSTALSVILTAQRDARERGDTLTIVAGSGTIARRVLQVGGIPHVSTDT